MIPPRSVAVVAALQAAAIALVLVGKNLPSYLAALALAAVAVALSPG